MMSRTRLGMRLSAMLIAGVALFGNLPRANADLLQYAGNTFGSSQDYGMYAAVRFTNPYSSNSMQVDSLWVYGNRQTTGDLDLYLWADAGDGPGTILATLSGEYLLIKGWQKFTLSTPIEIDPGASVFGGLHEAANTSDDWGANAPYDADGATVGRNYHKLTDDTVWTYGSPGGSGDLMVRLGYSQGEFATPEPGTLALLASVAAGCLLVPRRRRSPSR
jgi:hypothetical protein